MGADEPLGQISDITVEPDGSVSGHVAWKTNELTIPMSAQMRADYDLYRPVRNYLAEVTRDMAWEMSESAVDLIEGPRLGPGRKELAAIDREKRVEAEKAKWGRRYGLRGLGLRQMLNGCDCEEW